LPNSRKVSSPIATVVLQILNNIKLASRSRFIDADRDSMSDSAMMLSSRSPGGNTVLLRAIPDKKQVRGTHPKSSGVRPPSP
jgi:hypothetical protein